MAQHHGFPTFEADDQAPPYPPPSVAASSSPEDREVVNFCGLIKIHSYSLTVAIAVVNVILLCVGAVDVYRSDFCLYKLVPVLIYGVGVILLVAGVSLKKSYLLIPFLILQWLLFLVSLAVAVRFGLSFLFPATFGLYKKNNHVAVPSFIANVLMSDVEVFVVVWSLLLAAYSAAVLWVLHNCYYFLANIAGQKYYLHHQSASPSSSSDSFGDGESPV